jgi:hypothetical protein
MKFSAWRPNSGMMWAHVPAACVACRAGDAGSSPHILSVWGSLGILRCAQLAPGAALGALSYHPIGHSWPISYVIGYIK